MSQQFAGQQYELNVMHVVRKSISFLDIATTVSLGWVPEGANMIRGGVHVQTAFDAGAKTVDIGFRNAPGGETDNPDAFATLLTLAAVGVIPTDAMAASAAVDLTLGAEITASIVSIGAVAGNAVVWMEYIVDNDGDVSGA